MLYGLRHGMGFDTKTESRGLLLVCSFFFFVLSCQQNSAAKLLLHAKLTSLSALHNSREWCTKVPLKNSLKRSSKEILISLDFIFIHFYRLLSKRCMCTIPKYYFHFYILELLL